MVWVVLLWDLLWGVGFIMKNLEGLFEQVYQNQFNDFLFEIFRIQEWFKKEYPEGDLRVHMNANNSKPSELLTIETTILTGKEMSDNQGLYKNKMVIKKDFWDDPIVMSGITLNLFEYYKKIISDTVNKHYKKEKNGG